MVGIQFFLWPALAWLLVQPESLIRDHSQTALTPSAKKSKKTGSKRAQSTAATPLFTSEGQWISAATVGLVGSFLLLIVVGWWNNDRLLAQAKQNLSLGNGLEAYQQLATLTQRAPNQAEYWEQYALVLGQLAASAHTSYSATTAATLADEAVNSIDQATQANPVHLNIWKSRARVFLWLTTLSETYYQPAIEALQTAHELAPTDPKILYNLALMYEAVSQPELAESAYQQAIELRPNYEQARKSYAEFLTHQTQYAAALDQYHYIEKVLKPGENLFSEEIAALEASLSGEIAP
jgi:Flp pilus assembly protein TadD